MKLESPYCGLKSSETNQQKALADCVQAKEKLLASKMMDICLFASICQTNGRPAVKRIGVFNIHTHLELDLKSS